MDNALREQLASGTFRPGELLPPQRYLASDYGVSRDTVQRVLRHWPPRAGSSRGSRAAAVGW
ncbi:GntR family transcriptional regulator [Streptomyces sp. GTA36]